MQQVYASGPGVANGSWTNTPAPGRSLSLPAVRASSVGVGQAELQAVLPLAGGVWADSADADRPTPVRLALLNTYAGRLLTHTVWTADGYFAHSILNVPRSADAQLAIQTWGSPQWQRTPPDATADLPELPFLPVADALDDGTLTAWLDAPAHRELLEFALTALLGTPADTRVFLAAPADDVAKVLYAVTRVVPANLLDEFTFSTFEPDPLACSARLIGCGGDLPDACYRTAAALNTHTGKRTDLRADVPFAGFAVAALARGEFAPIDDLKATWQRLGLKEAKQFDLVYRLARGTGTLTKPEAADALQHPPLAAWVSTRADVLHQFLEWALDDRTFATDSFARSVQTLRQKPDQLAKLAAAVREAGVKAIQDGDKARTATALEVVFPMVAPAKANAVWGELLTQFADPARLPWEMRGYLLAKFVRFKQQQSAAAGVEAAFAPWLDVPTDRLADFLALDLPKPYHLAACRACLKRETEPTPALVATIAANPTLALTLLQPADGEGQAAKLYEALLSETPGKPWFEDVIAHAADYPATLLNRFFETSLDADKLDADRLVRTQGGRLFDLFAGQSALDRLGAKFLATPPADVLSNQTVLGFLGKLRDQACLSDELKSRIDAVRAVRAYLDTPTFTADAMTPVAAAFAVTPPALPRSAKQDVFDAVAKVFRSRSGAAGLQDDLESVLTQLGGTLAADPADLYENLLRTLRGEGGDFGRDANAVHTFLAVALGATRTPELAGKLDGLDGHAFAVAADAAKRGGNRLLDAVDRRSKDWPKEARTKWGFLLAAVRPKSRWQRDLTFAAVGAAVAAAVALALRFAI
jgi:hypothetical protein